MFGFFKKQIHEPLKKQCAGLSQYPDIFAQQILGVEDCDQLSNGQGSFGSQSNPIQSP